MTASKSDSKAALRAEMRVLRKAVTDRAERSMRIWCQVQRLPVVAAARTVLVFTDVAGEPETAPFIEWCVAQGKTIVRPEDDPAPIPALVDCVIVPGLAFTAAGDRLGQGGGWYDRFLARVRPEAIKIGVAFAPQIVESLPVEPHDVRMDQVISA